MPFVVEDFAGVLVGDPVKVLPVGSGGLTTIKAGLTSSMSVQNI